MVNDAEETKKELERLILQMIADRLKARKMDAKRSGQIARVVLAKLETVHSLTEIHVVLPEMSREFEELAEVLDPMYREFNARIHQAIDERLDQMIATGNIKQVHELVKEVYIRGHDG